MFDNIGGKIKGLAKFVCWVGIIISVIAGCVMVFGGSGMNRGENPFVFTGFMVMIVGSLLSWLGSLTLYGFGELVEKSTECADELKRQSRMMDDIKKMGINTEKNTEEEEGPKTQVKKPVIDEQGGIVLDPAVDSLAVGPDTDEYGWKKGEDPRFIFCPQCNARYSVDYMKYRDSCKECGCPRKKGE